MIKSLQISGVHKNLTKEIEDYTRKKIGSLDRFIPRQARGSAHAEVKLKQSKTKNKLDCTCEVIIRLPKSTITVHETETTMLSAIDITENKLKIQLQKYKETHGTGKFSRNAIRRFWRNP